MREVMLEGEGARVVGEVGKALEIRAVVVCPVIVGQGSEGLIGEAVVRCGAVGFVLPPHARQYQTGSQNVPVRLGVAV